MSAPIALVAFDLHRKCDEGVASTITAYISI